MKKLNLFGATGNKRAAAALAFCLSFLSMGHLAFAQGEQQFPDSKSAINALVTATKARDTNAMRKIFGPTGHELASADLVQASEEFTKFQQRISEKVEPYQQSNERIILKLGNDGWPFPIPLVNRGGHWEFDTEAGQSEILNRRIGMNELGAIHVCQAYASAQREYASEDRNGDEVLEFATHLRSSPGTHDGLYWPVEPGEDLSPLGPLVAEAHQEGYRRENKILTEPQHPYHGYYFKILTRQGKHAAGGKYNYIINGHMIGGFALVAWPAEWGNSGVMTFIINQQGKVFQKNLGPKTEREAAGMTTYDPDASWTPVRDD
ncbi:MAG TPA: DUF2950 domain-containing protein [Verrucomicrobiae bacterium]|jgi:hypothetical protein